MKRYMMKKRVVNFLSVLIISAMAMAGLGMDVQATGGTGDATLASLEVSPGTLSPEFSSGCHEYRVEVGEDCDKLLVNAQTTDSGAKAVIAGNSGLKAGANSVIVNVTAADGVTTARYTIQVMRGTAQEGVDAGTQAGQDPASENRPEDGIASTPFIMGNLPRSTEGQTESADGETAGDGNGETESREDLEDGQVPGSGELPEEAGDFGEAPDGAGQPQGGTVTSAGRIYTLSVPDEAVIPTGFTAVELTVGGQPVPAWQFPSNYEVTGLYLIYGTNQEGKTSFYLYDETEGTVVTAAEGLLVIGQEGDISRNQLRSAQETYQKSLKSRMMIIICLSVACVFLLIALTASLTRRKRGDGGDPSYRRSLGENEDRGEAGAYDGFPGDDDDHDGFFEDDEDYGDHGDLFEDDDDDQGGFFEDDDEDYDGLFGDDDDYDDLAGADEELTGREGDGGSLSGDGEESHKKPGGKEDPVFPAAADMSVEEKEEPGRSGAEPVKPDPKREEAGPAGPEAVREEVQKKKLLTEAEEEEPEWDTAPLPALEDTGRLEPLPVQEAHEEVPEAEDEESLDFGFEDIDLGTAGLFSDGGGGQEKDVREPEAVRPGNPDAESLEPRRPEMKERAAEMTAPAEPEPAMPEAGGMEQERPAVEGPAESGPEISGAGAPAEEAGPKETDLWGDEPEEAGFEEIMLEDVGPEEIRPITSWEEDAPEELPPGEAGPAPAKTEREEDEEDLFPLPEEDEADLFPLPEEDDEDLDAEFDLLDALLSDSVRSGRPDGANSIVNRAAEKAGREAPGKRQEKRPVNPVRDMPAKPRKK